MWYGPSRLVWKAICFPSGLQAGRIFEAWVFVSCRIGVAAALTKLAPSAISADRYRTRKSARRVTGPSGRVPRPNQPNAYARDEQSEESHEKTTKQERGLSEDALSGRGLRDEGVSEEVVGKDQIDERPDDAERAGDRLHRSLPVIAPAGSRAGTGSAGALSRWTSSSRTRRIALSGTHPLAIATIMGQRASVYRR